MPVKFPKGFGRRKSTATPFEDGPEEPVVEHSFKVFERPDGGSKSFDGGLKFPKVATAPVHGRSKIALHLEDDNMFVNVGKNRGSGASNTNTASTTDNSSRLSATSTAPSSTDVPHREDWRSQKEKSFEAPPIPKSTSAFSLKNAGRTLSWGRHKHPSLPSPKEPSSPTADEQSARARAATTSSSASTATPPKLDQNNDLGLSLGGDFSDMFAGFGKRKSVVMDVETNRSMSNSPESLPTGPANRFLSNSRLTAPSPLSFDKNKEVPPSPYSWSSQQSREGLMSSVSPPPGRDTPPPVPQHGSIRPNHETASYARQQRPDPGLRRSSALSSRRQSTLDYGDAIDEDARLLRESINASRKMNEPSYSSRVRDSWALPSDKFEEAPPSSWKFGSADTTPKAKKVEPVVNEDNMFDTQIKVAASVAQRYQDKPWSSNSYGRNATPKAPTNKVMTPAQFERYRQDQERLKSLGGQSKDEQEEEDEVYDDDDEDEAEKTKALAKQRRKQEAHMAVYRQQMMKVTGEAPSASRPGPFSTQSSPNLTLGGSGSGSAEDPEEDEEVPLAILQAHGFPSKTKPPVMRSMGSNPNLRAVGSPSGGVLPSGNLPVFARNLPQDPYYGAGIVTPAHRESISFSGGIESVSGAPSRGLPPGGLVGVIATEERSRAMRRGSPNTEGMFNPPPPNGFNGMGMQPPPAGSMYNGMGPPPMPMGPMGQMNPMMLTPGDAAQIQMSQQMSQFMQMQMQFMQMMTGAQGQQNGQVPHASMGEIPRPGSAGGLQYPGSSSHQRAMTMLEPNAAPWMQHQSMYAPSIRAQGNGYAPSIAPSERSNIGLPGRYRPVSQAPPAKDSRLSTMSGALHNWENKNGGATINAVKKSGNVSDDDDEEGWEEMAKKREKKKSVWKINKKDNKESSALKDILNYAQS